MKSFLYIVASFLENAATAIYDRIDMNPHADPELYVSRECLEEMERIARQDQLDAMFRHALAYDKDMLCAMLAQQETKH